MENLHFWISQYGYWGVFLTSDAGNNWILVPDETLLTFSGYLIFHGELKLIPTFLSAYLGSVAGISISLCYSAIHFSVPLLSKIRPFYTHY